jgi:DNA-binding response OmpR family regulator
MLTGDNSAESRQEALQGFADQYLVKPVSRETLMAAVGRVLGGGAPPAASEEQAVP